MMISILQLSYTSKDVTEGKKAAKKELQSRLGLAQTDRPLVGIVTRLTAQKGIHLIKHAIWRTLERGGQVHTIDRIASLLLSLCICKGTTVC